MGEAIFSVQVEDVAALVGDSAFAWPSPTLMILERLPLRWLAPADKDTGLVFTAFDPAASFNQYERGRIFHEAGELRWEKVDHRFWAVYVGDDQQALPSGFTRDSTLALEEPKSRTYYLWGKRLSEQAMKVLGTQQKLPSFAEFTVGGILAEYPAPPPPSEKSEQLLLEIAEYIDSDSQQLKYYRFKGVTWR